MPRSIPTACPMCGARECDHKKKHDGRASAARRGYSRDWQKLRLLVLAEEPLCRQCREEGRITPAVHVHHVKPVRTHPELRLVRTLPDGTPQLVPMCAPCHNRINDYA